MTTTVFWFRRDLRLDDSPALRAAAETADRLLPVYPFDPREYGERSYGGENSFQYRKTGAHRARFRRESVTDLRNRLRELDSDLLVRHGKPENVLNDVFEKYDVDSFFYHDLPTAEERAVEDEVREVCADHDVRACSYWGHTLHHPEDLPMEVREIPDTFTTFRKQIEDEEMVREPLDPPEALPSVPEVSSGKIPSLVDLDSELGKGNASNGSDERDERAVLSFEGGEHIGQNRLERYLWDEDRLREYKQTRNELLGAGYSSKFSPWLNEGCISPRRVYEEVREYERERVTNDSTYWLVFELRWRDFFQFQFVCHDDKHFTRGGIRERTDIDWNEDEEGFERWTAGKTGIPFVDANMRELNVTGYMSNRGRQNVASFLANSLRIDWRWGAAYFETQLVDYDPCSNYGNWAYVAGVGNDSRDSYFNIVKQANQYDPNAEYVRTWLPELDSLPAEAAHEPWEADEELLSAYDVVLGEDYPQPMVDLEASYEKFR